MIPYGLSLNQLAGLFDRDKSVISRHIDNIFREGELDREATVAKFATVQKEGGKEVQRDIEHYNLDVIISTGYRVKSKSGVKFRIWATGVIKKYLIKGYAIIGAVNQTFDGKELYPTVEEKAAHLLYFAVKDHPFTDGNKRLAAILFLHYMAKNGRLYTKAGEKRVSDGALAALTLLAAVSSPKEKETMINVIANAIGAGRRRG
jgi:hypothetical protein